MPSRVPGAEIGDTSGVEFGPEGGDVVDVALVVVVLVVVVVEEPVVGGSGSSITRAAHSVGAVIGLHRAIPPPGSGDE